MSNLADNPQIIDLTDVNGRFLVVHVLRTVTGVNLNAGADGGPKTLTLGDSQRLRISSQSLKRAMRTWITDTVIDAEKATRTRRIPGATAERVAERRGVDYDEALARTDALLAACGHTIAATTPEQTKEIVYTTTSTPDLLTDLVDAHWVSLGDGAAAITAAIAQADPTAKKGRRNTDKGMTAPAVGASLTKAVAAAFAPGASIEIALCGRMLTSVPDGDIDGAMSVAHAYSVDPIRRTDDYFTVRDDWQDGGFEDQANGAMVGNATLASGTLYQWAVLDRDQVRANLAPAHPIPSDLDAACADADRLFASAAIWALPKAHSRSTASNPAPALAVAATTDYQPLTAPCFEQAITDTPTSQVAAERLAAWLTRAQRRHPLTGGIALWGGIGEPPALPDALTVEEA